MISRMRSFTPLRSYYAEISPTYPPSKANTDEIRYAPSTIFGSLNLSKWRRRCKGGILKKAQLAPSKPLVIFKCNT